MYSAKKVKGERLYEIARRGESIERKAVWVNIHQLEAFERGGTLFCHNPDGTADLGIRVVCSAGTYIRTLAEALGERLGKPAHLAALRRIRAGRFRIEDAVSLEKLESLADKSHLSLPLLSPDAALSDMPFQHLTVGDALRTRHGAAIAADPQNAPTWADGEHVRLRDEHGNLIAVGRYDRRNESLKPEVVIDPSG
jgi:tRNA pseudouridine55 synthase